MVPGPGQPAGNGSFVVLEDPAGRGHIHPLAGGGHHFIHPLHRRFQIVHRGIPPLADFRLARLTPQILDGIRPIMPPISDQRVEPGIGYPVIATPGIRTTIPVGGDHLRTSTLAFLLMPCFDHRLLMTGARPVCRSADRAVAWTLRMPLSRLALALNLSEKPRLILPTAPPYPHQPNQKELVSQTEKANKEGLYHESESL